MENVYLQKMTKPKLNVFDFTMIMVTLVIGMGIFRTPASVAAASPTPAVFFTAWIFGGIVAICGALTYAEIGSRYPMTGGYYKIFSYAYHPSIAFGINCIILVSNVSSVAGVSIIGAEYIAKVLMPNAQNIHTVQLVIAIVSILILYIVNLAGLKMSARAQNVLTVIKICFIVLLISPIFFYANTTQVGDAITITNPTLREYIKAFGLGLVAVSFTYGGYQQAINFGEEVQQPAKNIPRGIIYGLFIIIVLYLSINYAYYKVIGFETLKTSTNIAYIMASHVFGNAAGNFISILLFLSVLAYVNVQLLSEPRVLAAMSDDGVIPKIFAQRTKNKNVPLAALTLATCASILVVFWAETFDQIMSFSIFLDCFGMVLSAATIFKLRKTTAHLNGTGIYQMKLFPLLPIIFMLTYAFVATAIFIDDRNTGLLGVGILALFIALYFAVKEIQKRQTNTCR
jgi:basic amino acid/polyamine antiporter, APA family